MDKRYLLGGMGSWIDRKNVVIAMVLAASLGINLISLINKARHTDFKTIGTDDVSVYEKQFNPLRKVLPEQEVIGYMDDRFGKTDDPIYAPFSEQFVARYYLAQYALAPHIIENSMRHRLIIGNFINYGYSKNMMPPGMRIVADFGNGLLLIEAHQE